MSDTNQKFSQLSPIIEMQGICKRFPGVLANDRIDLQIHKSEIHALLGENGAGKSTLMKILYGFYKLDEGCIFYNGEEVQIKISFRFTEAEYWNGFSDVKSHSGDECA